MVDLSARWTGGVDACLGSEVDSWIQDAVEKEVSGVGWEGRISEVRKGSQQGRAT